MMATSTERCPHPGEHHLGRIATTVGILGSHGIAINLETAAINGDTEHPSDHGRVNHHTVSVTSIVCLQPYGTDPWKKFWIEAAGENASLED